MKTGGDRFLQNTANANYFEWNQYNAGPADPADIISNYENFSHAPKCHRIMVLFRFVVLLFAQAYKITSRFLSASAQCK